ncbi:short transient receptor potential channel 3 [Paramuricea clavata]|uniref:Short transient receptor potential channel 3 n=1 Tax=Paramuricea clavata TaxID=317549 RepID=A0A6S7GCA1_PARCT|nr:short transient receptor potential channel 3 [Paramuricea clavata]
MSLTQNSNRAKEPDRLGHDFDCKESCCRDKLTRIDRWETVLKSYEELTKPISMANLNVVADDPLSHAFKLTHEIKNLKKTNMEVKSELKAFSRKSKMFTVDLLDACENSKEVDVIFCSGKDVEQERIDTLRKAVAAKHKEV